jgi:O-antigen/teichoic acid export membrane protein
MDLFPRLYTNAGFLWLGLVGLGLLGFAFWAVVARLYSPAAVGLAGTALTSVMLLTEVSHLGLSYALIRFIPQSGEGAPFLVSRSLAVVAITSFLSGLIFLSTVALWSQDLSDILWQRPGYAGGYLTLIVFAAMVGILKSIFIAYRRAVLVLALNLALGILRIPLAVLLGVLGSALGIVAGHGIAILVSVLLGLLVFLPWCIGRRLPLAVDLWRLVPLTSFALSNLASYMLTVSVWTLLPLLVISLMGAQAAGFFYMGWTVTGLVLTMIQQLGLSLFAEGSYNLQEFRSQVRGVLLVGIVLGGLFAVLVYFLGDLILLLLLGREYMEQSSSVLKILAAATPLAALTNVYLTIERVRQRLGPLVSVSAVVTVFMLGATAVLMPRVGIVGAGYGVMVGYGVGALISLPMLYSMMKRSHHSLGVGQSTAP